MGRFILKTVTNVIYHYILLYAILMAYKRSVGDVMKKQNKKLLLGLAAIMLVSCCIFIFITQGFRVLTDGAVFSTKTTNIIITIPLP